MKGGEMNEKTGSLQHRRHCRRRCSHHPPPPTPPPPFPSRYTGPTCNRRIGITAWRRAIKERERERCKEELRSLVDLKNPEVTPEASEQGEGEKKREKRELTNGGGGGVGWGG